MEASGGVYGGGGRRGGLGGRGSKKSTPTYYTDGAPTTPSLDSTAEPGKASAVLSLLKKYHGMFGDEGRVAAS